MPAVPDSAPKSDAWAGLLFIALLAQVVAAVVLFLDYDQTAKTPVGVPERPAAVADRVSGG